MHAACGDWGCASGTEEVLCAPHLHSYSDFGQGEGLEEAYRYFIASLKKDSTYAPSFTALGVYYEEAAADPGRASKCFQKAFELDPREADAARRLAIGFAEEKEWDLVEVVARRTIAGEGGLDAGLTSSDTISIHVPTNAWAWKAVGVVDLVCTCHFYCETFFDTSQG